MSHVTVALLPEHQRLIDAKSNALLEQLVNATPAQVQAWMSANVTNLAQAQTVLVALALGLRYVYLQEKSKSE